MCLGRLILLCVLTLSATVACSPAENRGIEVNDTRSSFLALLDRPKVPLAPEVRELAAPEGMKQLHFSVAADAEQRVPGYLLIPATKGVPTARRAVVIVLHGTGGKKDSSEVRSTVEQLAKAGFIGAAIDGRYHGERTKSGSGAAEYNEAIAQTWKTGREHPFYYDTVWDVMRVIDYLETRDDVDPTRIGLMGFSKGGIETYLTAAADPRVAVAVPCIGVQSFRWELDNGQWKARIATVEDAFDAAAEMAGEKKPGPDFVRRFYARVVPGIDGQFDGPAMLPLIAPRPLLVINSDSDANTPIAGVRLAVDAARLTYRALQAEEKIVLRIQENTPHRVNPESIEAGIAWFVRWLRP